MNHSSLAEYKEKGYEKLSGNEGASLEYYIA